MSTKYIAEEYRLANNAAPLTRIIKVGSDGNLTHFDEKKGYNRAIRHCPNEKSIFLDEQSKFAKLEPLIFETGYLRIPPTAEHTKKFLKYSPENVINGGTVFEIVDEELAAGDALSMDDLIMDLKTEIREKAKEKDGIHDLVALAATIEGSYVTVKDKPVSALRKIINSAVEANPRMFVKENEPELFTQDSKRTYFALRSIADGIIKISTDGRTIYWADTKNVIANVPSSHKPHEFLAEHFATDDGMLLLQKVADMI
ncbi:MAG: hypothetical protein HKN45_11350 [Flavobacteriales bacterium]|nr:hypothetical protein [Flavobacteriales bacterium]